MQVSISARHGQLSETTREKVAARFEKLSRIFERLTAIEVTINLEHKETLVVEVLVSAEHKHDFVATEQAGDLLQALDGAMHKVEQQLRKYKEKVLDRHRQPGDRHEPVKSELGEG